MYNHVNYLEDVKTELETILNIRKAIKLTFQKLDETDELLSSITLCDNLEKELHTKIETIVNQ